MIEQLKKAIISLSNEKGIIVSFSYDFTKILKKIKEHQLKIRLYKQILKIIEKPSIGKHMRFSRRGEQEVYLDSFRLYYKFYKDEKTLRFVEFSHKDEQS